MKNFFSITDSRNLNPDVVEHFKRNLFVNILDAGFWFFGDSFVAAYTIFPVFLSTMTDSPILIGLIPALEGAGWFIPQLFLAKYLEGRNRRLPLVRRLGLLDRFPFLLLAIAAFLIPTLEINLAIVIILFIYVVKVFSSGLVALPWQELIATVIPVTHRGRYWGFALIVGKLMGILGAAITGFMLSNIAYPQNYGYLFLIGFSAAMISYIFLSLNLEPEIDRGNIKSIEDFQILGKIRKIIRTDDNFRFYLINRAFVFFSFMGLGFITVYGLQRFNLPISYSAIFTVVMFIAEIMGYGIWGTIGDKFGYRRVIEYCNLILALGLLVIYFVNSILILYVVFGIISFAHSGEYVADQNIAMEFGAEKDRPTYIGMSKTLTGPVLLIAPILGGVFVKIWGYQWMFLISLFFSIIAYVFIRFFVREPRLNNHDC